MDRKIELDKLSEEMFQDVMLTVNSDILKIATEAQNKINELLFRFNVKCDLSLSYGIIPNDTTSDLVDNLPTETELPKLPDLPKEEITPEVPVKKKRASRKKKIDS